MTDWLKKALMISPATLAEKTNAGRLASDIIHTLDNDYYEASGQLGKKVSESAKKAIESIKQGYLAIPDQALAQVDYHSVTPHSYSDLFGVNANARAWYNPKTESIEYHVPPELSRFTGSGLHVPAHEVTHGMQYNLPWDSNAERPVKEMTAVHNYLYNPNTKHDNYGFTKEDFLSDTHKYSPIEHHANDTADVVSDYLLEGSEKTPGGVYLDPGSIVRARNTFLPAFVDTAYDVMNRFKSNNPDLLKDALKSAGLLGTAGIAVGVTPNEGETASIPWKTAENFLLGKMGAQYKIIPQELKDNLRKIVTRDIPAEYGLSSPSAEALDLQFLKKTLTDKNRFKFDPTIMNNIRLGQTAIPEEVMSRANLDIKFLDPKSVSKGNLRPLGNTGFQVGYNPLHPDITGSGLGTAGHELGGHLPQLMKTHFGSFDPKLDDKISFVNNAGLLNKAELRTLPYSPADKKTEVYEKATPEQREIIDRAWRLYEDNSMERVARDMGDIFLKKARQSDLASLKDYENFKKIYGAVSNNAYLRYSEENPELAAELVDRLRVRGKIGSNLSKAALATPFAIAGTSHASTPNQEKSNFDGLVNDDGVYGAVKRVEDEKTLKSPKGIWELGKMIPGLVAPAIPAVRQMISGFVENEVKKIGKSAKKLVSLKEGDKADWEDYANVLQLADKPGLLMMGHDVAKGIGEPMGKRIAEGINDFYESNRVASEFFDGQ